MLLDPLQDMTGLYIPDHFSHPPVLAFSLLVPESSQLAVPPSPQLLGHNQPEMKHVKKNVGKTDLYISISKKNRQRKLYYW